MASIPSLRLLDGQQTPHCSIPFLLTECHPWKPTTTGKYGIYSQKNFILTLAYRRNIYHVLCGRDVSDSDSKHLKLFDYILEKLPKDVTRTLLRQQTKQYGETVSIVDLLLNSVVYSYS